MNLDEKGEIRAFPLSLALVCKQRNQCVLFRPHDFPESLSTLNHRLL